MPEMTLIHDNSSLHLLQAPALPQASPVKTCRPISGSLSLLKTICEERPTKGLGEVLITIYAVCMNKYANVSDFSLVSAICDFVTSVSESLARFDPEKHEYRIMYTISVLLALHYLDYDINILVAQLRYLETCLAKTKKSEKRRSANKRLAKNKSARLCRVFATESVELKLPSRVHVWDVETGQQVRFTQIQWAALFEDLTGSTSGSGSVPAGSPTAPAWCSNRNVSPQDVREHGFKILSFGSYFGLRRSCPNGPYRLVFAARFTPWDELTEFERGELTFWAHWLILVTQHGSKCINNSAHNRDGKEKSRALFSSNAIKKKRREAAARSIAAKKRAKATRVLSTMKREGILIMAGWRVRRQTKSAKGETLGEYVPGSMKDRRTPRGYIDMNVHAARVRRFWLLINQRISPRAVAHTCETLSAIGAPMFGSHSTDFSTHTPFMGSSMSVSYNDKAGRQFANVSHTDEDIDKDHAAKVFTSVSWVKVNVQTRQIVQEIDKVKAAMSDQLFVFPGYRFALDLRAAPFINLMMRGGMDEHFTSQSSITDMDCGIRSFGSSVQTNRHIARVVEKYDPSTFRSYVDHLPKGFTELTLDSEFDTPL